MAWGFLTVCGIALIWDWARGGMTEKQIKAAKQQDDQLVKESLKALDVERAQRERERRIRKQWGFRTSAE